MAAADLVGRAQGLLRTGYLQWPRACFYLIRFKSQSAGRCWLQQLHPWITWIGENDHRTDCFNVALTYEGIRKLTGSSVLRFPEPFQEGMDSAARARVLGDVGENAPEEWVWGHEDRTRRYDILLLHYMPPNASSDGARQFVESDAVADVHALPPTVRLSGSREHFGFIDGISQPLVSEAGMQFPKPAFSLLGMQDTKHLPLGEFLLGYPNAMSVTEPLPTIEGRKFGLDGSYLVLRQLEQRVEEFWSWARSQTNNDEEAVTFASKLMGRQPDGRALIKGNPGM